jgi:hypothetical protein
MPFSDWCIHYRGLQHETCKLGIRANDVDPAPDIRDNGVNFGVAKRIPCIKDNGTHTCASCHYPTDEENAQHEAEMQEYMSAMREDSILIGAAHSESGPSTVFVCELCERNQRVAMSAIPELLEHMLTAHNIEWEIVRFFKGQESQHLDATDWFQTNYVFEHNGKRALIKSVRSPRTGSNRRAWQDSVPTKRKGKR